MAMHVLLLKNTKGVFPIEGFRLEVYLREFTRHCVILILSRAFVCSLKGRWYERLTHKRTFFRWFREVRVYPLVEWPHASAYHVCKCGELYTRKICILTWSKGTTSGTRRPCSAYGFLPKWIKAHPELLSVILFSDEASFTRDGVNNLRNVRTWSHDNPHETSITNFQRRFSVNVWCGVLGNKLIGPIVFDNNLTGNTYEAFLRNELPGLLEDIPLMIRSQIRHHCFCYSIPLDAYRKLLCSWWRTLWTITVRQVL